MPFNKNPNMTHLEIELDHLNHSVMEMLSLAKRQLIMARESFFMLDADIAQEILYYENKLNSFELSIDRECENIFALYNPVAIDLRFVLSVLKINSSIERIGDVAKGIAKYVIKVKQPAKEELLVRTRCAEMFETAIEMLNHIESAMVNNDTLAARKVFKKDSILDDINRASLKSIQEYITSHPDQSESGLVLFSVINKLERAGDHSKNIAEEIIFHLEAKVLKHKKINKQRNEIV